MPPQSLVKPRKCNNMTYDSEKQVHKTLKELFKRVLKDHDYLG